MSFFSKILKGLGFEEDEDKTTKQPKPAKVKEKKEKLKPNFASFDLNQEPVVEEPVKEETAVANMQTEEVNTAITQSSSLDIIKVTSQIEVQKVVDKIKNDEQVIVNMLALSQSDLTRSLDFLTGAVYALNKTMQKVDEAIFIIH